MATILAVSSFVARGTVGLRAIMPALDRMGHEVIAFPTTLLSNHLGHPRADGAAVPPETLVAMFEAFDANGWLAKVDAIQTGYLPSPDHVHFVETMIDRVRAVRPDALIVCDPVLGDHPGGLYVPENVAHAVRDRLLPRATHVKPNPFELSFLARRTIESLNDVVNAARSLPPPIVLASSVHDGPDRLANVIVTQTQAGLCSVRREQDVPHGTGDLLTALFTAHALEGKDPLTCAALAAAGVAAAIAASRGHDELQLASPIDWHRAPAVSIAAVAAE